MRRNALLLLLALLTLPMLLGCATTTSSIESGAVVEDAARPDHVALHVTYRVESRF